MGQRRTKQDGTVGRAEGPSWRSAYRLRCRAPFGLTRFVALPCPPWVRVTRVRALRASASAATSHFYRPRSGTGWARSTAARTRWHRSRHSRRPPARASCSSTTSSTAPASSPASSPPEFRASNATAMLTSWGANCGLSTIGGVRLVVEPKPGLPTDPDNPRAFIDVFTDIRGLFVINNESGWYEGWMIHDLRVAPVGAAVHGKAQFGTITPEDHALLAAMGTGNNGVAGNFFTVDGKAPHSPSPSDHFPDKVTNVLPLQLSMGADNALQQADAHNYWEFNYTTNWIHALYELPFTGGFPDKSATEPADTYQDGEISARQSIVPGDEPGDNNRSRQKAVAFGDTNGDGIVSAAEGDIDTASAICPQGDLTCIYLLPRSYNRFAVTREINDGLLAPRFAPSTRGWVLSGTAVTGFPVVPASQGRDSDDR